MKRNRYTLQLIALLMMMLSSCHDEMIDLGGDQTDELGKPVVINMAFNASQMDIKTRAALDSTKEKAITSIAVFVFDSKGQTVSQVIHENASAHSSAGTEVGLRPNGTDFITIETLAGNNCTIFAIANYHSNLIEGFRSVGTLSDMNTLIVTMLGNPLLREFGICKVDKKDSVNIRQNGKIVMELKFLSAKITVNVNNKCDELTVTGWTADELPLKSYIVPRKVGTSDLTYHDAVNPLNGEDFYHDFADQILPFETKPPTNDAGSINNPMRYSSTFYMYENRRGDRVKKELPSGWPTPGTAGTDQKLKAWFAPQKASLIKLFGHTKSEIEGTKTFTFNHYLGSDNHSDYNIERGTHYTYNITINGLTNVSIDTNIEQYDLSIDVRPPADLRSLDAHATSRPFILYTDAILDPEVQVIAEVLESVGSENHPKWLDLTTTPYIYQHVRSTDPNISLWQQDGADYSYVRPKFIPNKATRDALGAKFTPPAGVKIPSALYPDDDKTLDYNTAHHRMCKTITNIPTKATDPNLSGPLAIFLQSTEFEYTSTLPYREAAVRFTYRKVGQLDQHTTYVVRQYPPYCFTKAPDNSGNILLVERIEEYEHTTDANTPMSLQMNAGMQWGKYDLPSATNTIHGFDNTLTGVYKTTTGEYYKGGNYLKKYGSLSGAWYEKDDGEIVEDNTIQTIGTPISSLPLPTDNKAHNTVYNTTAARYCHEKNTDLNGDGNIDPDETFWYLPALSELQLFWTYHEIVKMKGDFYWSSTQVDAEKAYSLSMLNESSAAHLTFNGTAQGLKKEFVNVIGPPRVRCIRRLTNTAKVTPVQPLVSHLNNGTSVIDCSNLPSSMYTTTSKYGIKQGNAGAVHAANKLFFKKFEVQNKENADTPDFSALHFGNGMCDVTKGWRLPTQREMLLIFSVRDQLKAGTNFEDFHNVVYWTMSRDMDAHYVVDFNTGLSKYGKYFEPTNKFRYRCVKELK